MLLVSYAMWPLSFLLNLSYSLGLQRNNDNTPTNWGCALTPPITHSWGWPWECFADTAPLLVPASILLRQDYDSMKKLHLLMQAWVLVQDCEIKFPRSRKSTKSCDLDTKICISWRLVHVVPDEAWRCSHSFDISQCDCSRNLEY